MGARLRGRHHVLSGAPRHPPPDYRRRNGRGLAQGGADMLQAVAARRPQNNNRLFRIWQRPKRRGYRARQERRRQMSRDKILKMRPGEQDDFRRWATLTSASANTHVSPALSLSQPSAWFVNDFIPPRLPCRWPPAAPVLLLPHRPNRRGQDGGCTADRRPYRPRPT